MRVVASESIHQVCLGTEVKLTSEQAKVSSVRTIIEQSSLVKSFCCFFCGIIFTTFLFSFIYHIEVRFVKNVPHFPLSYFILDNPHFNVGHEFLAMVVLSDKMPPKCFNSCNDVGKYNSS